MMLKRLLRKIVGPRQNLLGPAMRKIPSHIKVDFDFAAYANRHIFNKVSQSLKYGFYYFPYGYLFRFPLWGTINEMGFRCKENIYEIRETYPEHCIVAIFGASAGFSVLVPDEDTFAVQLEMMLNADQVLLSVVGKRFKVVNLSQPANVMLNHIINYIVFCHKLRPEIVISHGGIGDFAYGQHCDRTLLSRYDICYPEILEAWGRKLHDTTDVELDCDSSDPASPQFKPVVPKNRPEDVVNAYHARVVQFAALVQANGARFISGFQPWLTSKAKISQAEEASLKTSNPYNQIIYANVPMLGQMYDRLLEQAGLDYVVNLHRVFSKLGDETSHFGDNAHTLTPGDRVIAEAYYHKVRSFYLPTGKE